MKRIGDNGRVILKYGPFLNNITFDLHGLALLVRIFFVQTYYGWEESDYGNLAMVYGVWESGFTHYESYAGYYFVGAMLYALVRSSIWAGLGSVYFRGWVFLHLVHRLASKWSTLNTAALMLHLD